jgi:hypothetical protein
VYQDKMIMKSKFVLLVLFAIFTFSSCHKDTEVPVVTVSSPADASMFNSPVTISGTTTDNSLHEMSLKITRDADGTVLFEKELSVHDLTSYTFNETFTPAAVSATTDVTLIIRVEDHEANETIKTVKFKLIP